jgi:hypothetical protein
MSETKNYEGKFYGEDKIISSVVSKEHKTPDGDPIIEIKIEKDNKKKTFLIPEKKIDYVVSDKKLDATEQRDKESELIAEKIMNVIAEYNLAISDWEYINAIIKNSIESSFQYAENILWGTDRKRLLDVDRILKSVEDKLVDN